MPEEVYSAEVHYSGRVQGVGFRYTTLQVARQFEVTGCVQNLSDGRVRLVAEGREEEVRSFLAEIGEQMKIFIRRIEEKSTHRERRHRDFLIAR